MDSKRPCQRHWFKECYRQLSSTAGIEPIEPDAILHGKWSYRPRSRAVQRLAVAGLSSEASQPAQSVVAPPACGPSEDTSVTFPSRLCHLAPGQPPLLAVRWPGATGLTSYLSGCLSLTGQRCFQSSPASWKVLSGLALTVYPPRGRALFLFVFRRVSWANPAMRGRQNHPIRAGAQ